MGGHGDSQAVPTVSCTPEAAAPWVPVTSTIPGLTPLPAGAPVPTFPLHTAVPTLATHLPHGETDPDGPMGGAGASEPIDETETSSAAPTPARDIILKPETWPSMSKRQRQNWLKQNYPQGKKSL